MNFITKKQYKEETKNLKFLGFVGNSAYAGVEIEVYSESETEFKLIRNNNAKVISTSKNANKMQMISLKKDVYHKIEEEAGGESYCSYDVFNAFDSAYFLSVK